MKQPTIIPVPVRKSIRVEAPPADAFAVFTEGIGDWWPKTHHIGRSPLDRPIIEPHAGGRWYQRGVDGEECEVGRVLVWDPPARLVLSWQLGPDFKFDPGLITEVDVRFIADSDGATRVELEHRHLERLGDRADVLRRSVDSPNGWGALLELFARSAAQKMRSKS